MAGNSGSDLALIGRMKGDCTASPGARSERGGSPYRYHFAARAWRRKGSTSKRRRQGWKNKTLLIPYLRDPGTGTVTEVSVESGGVRLVHGEEEVEISYGAPVRRVVHLTGGLQNRRGLCGLLRIEFREMSQGISYRIRATR